MTIKLSTQTLKKQCIQKILALLLLPIFALTSGCTSSKGISTEEMQKALINFQLPEQPQKNKGIVYLIHDQTTPIGPLEISTFFGGIDKERYDKMTSSANTVFNIFTLGIFEENPNTDIKKISHLAHGEYATIQLNPGFYEFQYKVVRCGAILTCPPNSTFLEVKAGQIHYIYTRWRPYYNRYSGQMMNFLDLVGRDTEITGMFRLSKNLQKSNK